LDTSCSMGPQDPKMSTVCNYYANLYAGGSTTMTKIDTMKAALTGCQSANDGLLQQWSDKVNFAVWKFTTSPGSISRVSDFGASLGTMQTSILALSNGGNTPMTQAIANTAQYFQSFLTSSLTSQCAQNYIVELSDGEPNSSAYTYNFNC